MGALGGLTRWVERGWKRQQINGRTVYRGPYMVKDPGTGKYLAFRGEIVEGEGRLAVTVSGLPAETRNHPKRVCFSPLGNDVYIVGWMSPPRNVDEAIFYVEKVIAESLNRNGQ
ncbi:MAG: hypothetical protein HY678_09180 [Chloroflexi bacterium]|nr:hypothetical protein [Chloroflexota bacterium]